MAAFLIHIQCITTFYNILQGICWLSINQHCEPTHQPRVRQNSVNMFNAVATLFKLLPSVTTWSVCQLTLS